MKIKRTLSILLSVILLFSMAVPAFASTRAIVADNNYTNIGDGLTIGANVLDINDTGSNLTSAAKDQNCEILNSRTPIINSAVVNNNAIKIEGVVNSENFCIEGKFCSISANGNVLVFKAKDTNNKFNVVFCAVEQDLSKAALYFGPTQALEEKYDVVTKLYLRPINSKEDFVMIEMFGNSFPTISEQAIDNLPEDHYMNQFWYAREFKPISVSTTEETTKNRAGNSSYGQLEMYTYIHLGMRIDHCMRYWQDCDIRDVTRLQTSSASATIRISDKWVDAPTENNSADDYSILCLEDVSIVYLTRPETAVTQMSASGIVTQDGAIVSSFKYGIGVGIKGLSATASVNFTWEPGNSNMNTGVYHQLHSNAPDSGYWREAEGKLKSNQYLNDIGNKYVVNWIYCSYSNVVSTKNASLVFKYYVHNPLDYTYGHAEADVRTFSVNVT